MALAICQGHFNSQGKKLAFLSALELEKVHFSLPFRENIQKFRTIKKLKKAGNGLDQGHFHLLGKKLAFPAFGKQNQLLNLFSQQTFGQDQDTPREGSLLLYPILGVNLL